MSKNAEKQLLHKNTKPTSMRILVYELLAQKSTAMSLSEIETHFYKADRITLYRTLKTFEEKGIVHSIQENSTSKYMLCAEDCDETQHKDTHLHLYCTICKQTTCQESIILPQNMLNKFKIASLRFFAKGICESCQ